MKIKGNIGDILKSIGGIVLGVSITVVCFIANYLFGFAMLGLVLVIAGEIINHNIDIY